MVVFTFKIYYIRVMGDVQSICNKKLATWSEIKARKRVIYHGSWFFYVKILGSPVNIRLAPHVQGYFLWLFRLLPIQRHLAEEESWDTTHAQCARKFTLGRCGTSYIKGLSCYNVSLQIGWHFACYLLREKSSPCLHPTRKQFSHLCSLLIAIPVRKYTCTSFVGC